MIALDAIQEALSYERFARYVDWAAGHRARALELYTLNAQLSEALYVPLQALEIALRNRIHTVMSAAAGERWFDVPGMLEVDHQREQIADASADLIKANKDPTAGRIIASLTFSFWTAMASPSYESLWRSVLNGVAVRDDGKRPTRKEFSRPLTQIRLLRNRIAHHEPVLHWDLPKHHDFRISGHAGPSP